MSRWLTPRLAWIASALGLALTIGALVLGYRLNVYSFRGALPNWYFPLAEASPAIVSLIVGGLIAVRLPGNFYGWVWILFGWGFGALQPWGSLLASLALSVTPPKAVLGGLSVELATIGWLLGATMIPFIFLLYPTGHLPSRRWRFLAGAILVSALIGCLIAWAVPGQSGVAPVENPFGRPGSFGEFSKWLFLVPVSLSLIIGFPLGVLSLFLRYRGGTVLERAQIKWLAYAAGLNLVFFLIGLAPVTLPLLAADTQEVLITALLATLPVAVAVAVLRYRLFDIDVIIRRTLIYGALTATLALVFFGSVLLLQQLISQISGIQKSQAAIAISTLVIAALFSPLRGRIQNAIDRRFYRRKYDAEKALAAFSHTARGEVDPENLSRALLAVVDETLQPAHTSLWINTPGGLAEE